MLELPLPPLRNRFGEIQRRVASESGAILIPKRVFCRLLTGNRATLDSIHLSKQGHQRAARIVWDLVGDMMLAPTP